MSTTNLFQATIDQQDFLIMTHRGLWGGNIIQNTRQAADLAYRAGSDIVEVDVCRSKDGVYYLFHDGGEEALLGRAEHFSQWEAVDLDQVSLRNSLGQLSGYFLERLEDFLTWLPKGALVNLDRSWPYFKDPSYFDILQASGKINQLLIKSPVNPAILQAFSDHGSSLNLPYMPIISRQSDLETVAKQEGLNLLGLELIIKEESDLLAPDFIQACHRQGLFLMANAEKLGQDYQLFADWDDDRALFSDYAWASFLEAGMDIIQTDWPMFLSDFRQSRIKR